MTFTFSTKVSRHRRSRNYVTNWRTINGDRKIHVHRGYCLCRRSANRPGLAAIAQAVRVFRKCYELSIERRPRSGNPRVPTSCHHGQLQEHPLTEGPCRHASFLNIAAFAVFCNDAGAQQPFYAGKSLTILVNYDAGGPTDLEARLLSRHLGRHIAGNPRIIVQNMGGAGGIVGTKYLGEIAPRDGTMLGYFTGSSQRFVTAPERFSVDFRTYEFIAVVPSGRIHFMRTDVRPGNQDCGRRDQRRKHRGRRLAARRTERHGDAAHARHARCALCLRNRIQF